MQPPANGRTEVSDMSKRTMRTYKGYCVKRVAIAGTKRENFRYRITRKGDPCVVVKRTWQDARQIIDALTRKTA